MYLDALAEDQNAFQRVDTDAFYGRSLDIFERCPDQHNANEIAAFLAALRWGMFQEKESAHNGETSKIAGRMKLQIGL